MLLDVVDAAKRSRMMAGILGKDDVPEMLVRRGRHVRGLGLGDRYVPGRRDGSRTG